VLQIINVTSAPNQTLNVTLSIDNTLKQLILNVDFNEMANYWWMRISDQNANILLDSLPLVTGVWPAANVLRQYASLGLGSLYVVNVAGAAIDYPDQYSLGQTFQLWWGDTSYDFSYDAAA